MKGLRGPLALLVLGWPLSAVADEPLLPPCPDSPNCVSSLAADEARSVEPLRAGDSREQAVRQLGQLLDSLPRVEWEQTQPARLEAEFRSAILRFVDDVIFHVHEDGRIDVRSASRVGYWDLGANRRRVERLRGKLTEHGEP